MPVKSTCDMVVVFDVDDTLYLERDYVASGFVAVEPLVQDRFGRCGFADVAWRLFEEGRRGDIFDHALRDMGLPADAELIAALVDAYRHHRPRISLLPDAHAALTQLQQLGVTMAVLSDGPAVCQEAKIVALGVNKQVQYTVLTGRYGPGYSKPHPRGFQEIAHQTGARRCIYVADNPHKDFVAPHRLGWLTIRVRRAGGLHAAVPHGEEVTVTLSDLGSLVSAVL